MEHKAAKQQIAQMEEMLESEAFELFMKFIGEEAEERWEHLRNTDLSRGESQRIRYETHQYQRIEKEFERIMENTVEGE